MESLSIEKFNECLRKLVEISRIALDGWQLHTKKGQENGTYVTKKDTLHLTHPSNQDDKLVVNIEYHVVFNISYGVPMLCINIWRLDGSYLPVEELGNYGFNFMGCEVQAVLSQMDHPVLHKPILTLHPCKTHEILQSLLQTSKNPVISWLSVVGPFVNLELPLEYFDSCWN